jgi:hypothetical protein
MIDTWVRRVATGSTVAANGDRLLAVFIAIALAAAALSFLGDGDGNSNPPVEVGTACAILPWTNSSGYVFFSEGTSASLLLLSLSLRLSLMWLGGLANAVVPREGGVVSALPPPSLLDGPKIGAVLTATTPKKSGGTGTAANIRYDYRGNFSELEK